MIRNWMFIGAALLGLLTGVGRGGEPADGTGYVLLRDLAVLRGSVEEEPGKVIIRYRGSEIRMAREKVACWAETLDGLYQYQLDRRRVFNIETHLDAARWCIRHGLHERAAAEIVAAGRLRPNDPSVSRIEAELRLAIERRASARNASADPQSGSPPASVGAGSDSSPTDEDTAAAEASAAEREAEIAAILDGIHEDQLREFNLRIQPLLANRCSAAACHDPGSAATWTLHSEPSPGMRPSAEMTRENLASVLSWIDRETPQASPLLVRALQAHGESLRPPLGPRDEEAIANLKRWIESLPSQRSPFSEATPQLASHGDPQMISADADPGSADHPVRLPHVADPFDPDLFNRRFHPSERMDAEQSQL